MSELKCCKRCGAFHTCTHKGECCPECQWYDPKDNLCLAPAEKAKPARRVSSNDDTGEEEIDPQTFLFDDDDEDFELPDDEDEDLEDEDFGFDDDDW